jgi:hypothetical protein
MFAIKLSISPIANGIIRSIRRHGMICKRRGVRVHRDDRELAGAQDLLE